MKFKTILIMAGLGLAINANANANADNSLKCMADNIYHEARGESLEGQLAVGYVTLNRIYSDERGFNKPGSIDACDVVYYGTYDEYGNVRKHRCQFSWTCDGKPDVINDAESYSKILKLAENILSNPDDDPTEGALFYKTLDTKLDFGRPYAMTIGNHNFYN